MRPAAHQATGASSSEDGGEWQERNKRSLQASDFRRAERRKRAPRQRNRPPSDEDDFSVEDGDEDAWVNDGVDDIQIDPETKRAASELSHDERSIDAEYEPYASKEAPVPNRTRITTIAEVIPMSDDSYSDLGDSTKVERRFLPAPPLQAESQPNRAAEQATAAKARTTLNGGQASFQQAAAYLPAAYLTIDQAQKLIGEQHEQLELQRRRLRDQQRQLVALSNGEPS